MANSESATNSTAPPPNYAPVAALLSYLVPGLGQIIQGRIAKGVLFLVCLYGLFFYGMYLGHWRNVYIPESAPPRDGQDRTGRMLDMVTDKARFAGQFWIGAAAWPAIAQHLGQPAQRDDLRDWHKGVPPHSLFGTFMRAPDEEELNDELRSSDKKYELGWMYTVIAGVLNILVIYDAFAGPAFVIGTGGNTEPRGSSEPRTDEKKEEAAVA